MEAIGVAIRCKPPFNPQEPRAWSVLPETNTIISNGKNAQGKEMTFTFDRVHGENATTCQIYDGTVKDIVASVAEKGINGTGEFFP